MKTFTPEFKFADLLKLSALVISMILFPAWAFAQSSNSPIVHGESLHLQCTGGTVSACGLPGAVYSWTFPGGFTSSVQNPVLNVGDAGYPPCPVIAQTSTYTLTITGVGSPQVGTTLVTLAAPTISGTAAICEGYAPVVYFTETGMTSYSWSISGGVIPTTGPGDNAITVSWTTAGTYTMTVSYLNSFGCNLTSSTKTITVWPRPVPTITGLTPVCNGATATYTTETGMNNYVWTIPTGGGTVISGGSTSTSTIKWNTEGSQSVNVSYNSVFGCPALTPTAKTVIVNPAPNPTITGSAVVCRERDITYTTDPDMASYLWNVGPGGLITSGAGTRTITVKWSSSAPGTSSVTVNYTNPSGGCSAAQATVKTITVNPAPTPTITGHSAACAGSTGNVYYTESGMTGYSWNVPGGSIDAGSSTNSITVTWGAAGTKTVSINYALPITGCTAASATVSLVTVNPVPTITGTTPGARCGPGTVILGATASAGTINWYAAAAGGTSLGAGGTFTTTSISSSTTYYVDATAIGCTTGSRTAISATVNDIPTITGTTPAARCGPGTLTLGATASTSTATINWYAASTGGASLGTGSTYTTTSISVTTTYYVDATAGTCTTATRTAITATVNTIPAITGVTPAARCGPGAVTLGATSSAGTVNWYDSETGGSATATGTTYSPTLSATAIFYVDATAGSCTTASRTAVTGTVNDIPTITGTTPAARCGPGSVTLAATSSAGTIKWYTAATGGASIGTGGTYTTTSISVSTPYYVDATAGTCTTATRTVITATVNDIPSITATVPAARCGSGNVTLGATASTSSATINWYTASTGGTILWSGISYTTSIITTTTTYYVDATIGTCTTASRTAITATINEIPTITGTTPATRCGPGTVTLGASASAGTINWYAASTGGVSLGTGATYITPVITATTTYFVDAFSGTCTTTTRTAITATVYDIPTITGTAPAARCGSGNVTLGATASTSTATINWYTASTGGTLLWTGISYTTPIISANTTYYVDATAGTCTTATRTAITATINDIPSITGTSPAARCGTGSVTLGATSSSGTINWYSAPSAGTLLGTGGSFNTPVISATANYYVDATSGTCATTTRTVVIATINPIPAVTTPNTAIICSGTSLVVNLTATIPSTFTWSVGAITGGISGAAAGSGATITQILTNPSNTAAGTVQYLVTPASTTGSCVGSVYTILVTVNPTPAPTLTGTGSICPGSTGVVYFTETGKYNYAWTISSGGSITSGGTSTDNTATVSWLTSGNQTITVNYSDTPGGCSAPSPTAKTVTVVPATAPPITSFPLSACTSATVYYSTVSGMTLYQWNVSPGGTVISGTGTYSIGVIWSTAGLKTVSVSYINTSNCLTQGTTSVTVNAAPEITIIGNATSCLNVTENYSTEAGKSLYLWTISTGGTITTGLGTNAITVLWTQAGARSVSVNYTNPSGGCAAAQPAAKSVTVYAPVPVISGPGVACAGGTGYEFSTTPGMTNYLWNVSSGGTIMTIPSTSASTITVVWNATGLQTVYVNYTDTHGCTATSPSEFNLTVNARPAVPVISGSTTACMGSAYTYTTLGGMPSYNWNVSSGGTIITSPTTNASSILVRWNTASVQTVQVNYTNGAGCTALTSGTLTCTVSPPDTPGLTGTLTTCMNTTGNGYATESGKTNYLWTVSPGGTITSGGTSSSNTIIVTWTTAGVKTVTVNYANSSGCMGASPASFTSTVNPIPDVNAVSGQLVCNGSGTAAVTFTGSVPGTVYNWTNTNPLIGIAATGAGNIGTFTATNTGASPVTATITVTPGYTNGVTCIGIPTSFTIVVNPTPTVTSVGSQVVSNGAPTAPVTFTGSVPGTVFTWANTTPSIGLAASGTGNIGTFTATNTNASPVTATITVTPSYTSGGVTCTGSPTVFTIAVYSQFLPGVATASQTVCTNAIPVTLTATSPTGGNTPYSYQWQSAPDNVLFSNILGATLLTYQPGAMTVTTWFRQAQTASSGGGTVFTNAVKITVNPLPAPTISGPGAACLNSSLTYITQPGMTGYSWAVTGGIITGPSNTNTISVTWNALGSQTVSVNYFDANGCTAATATAKSVTVQNIITPSITGNGTACNGNTYIYYTTQTGMLNYLWAIPSGGGTILSGQGTSSITVIWNTTGSKTLSLIFNDPVGCTVLTPTVLPVVVNTSPVPTITGTGSICTGSSGVVYFTETGMTNYTWTITGGTITDGAGTSAITVAWLTAGNQTITVNYSNASGCNAANASVKTVTIVPATPPTISGFPANVCTGSPVFYSIVTGMTNYTWTITPGGTIISGSGTNAITVLWNATGAQSVSVSCINSQGCPTNSAKSVSVNESPTPTITGDTSVCLNEITGYSTETGKALYLWSVGSGGIITSGSGTNSIMVKWTQTGARTVTVNYTDPFGGCSAAQATVMAVTAYSPVPVIAGPAFGCVGGDGSVFSTAAGMSGYTWSVTGGTITSGSGTQSITVVWSSSGLQSVYVSYTDIHGCTAATPSRFDLTVNPRPANPIITGTTVACTGTTVCSYSTQTGMNSYLWSVLPGVGTITGGQGTNAITVTWLSSGTQTVTVNYSNGTGCSTLNPGTYSCVVSNQPNPTFVSGQSAACVNATGNIYSTQSGNSNYIWTVSPGGTITSGGTSASSSITVTWTTPGLKTVTVNYSNISGCNAAIPASFTATVNPVPDVNSVLSQVICNTNSTAAVTFTGSVPGTVYSWTNTTPSIGLGAVGTGNIGSFTATNNGTSPVTATITVIPTFTNGSVTCIGASSTFTIVVNPTPTVSGVGNQTVSNGSPTTPVSFTGTIPGTIFTWTNSAPSIGLGASGTGSIGVFTATNTSASPVTATITVVPSYNGGGLTCTGTPTVFNILVYAQFLPGIATPSQTICANTSPAELIASSPSGGNTPYSYQWQISFDNVLYSNISGATLQTLQPGSMTTTTWYRQAQTSSSSGGTVLTNAVKITVNSLPLPTITGPGAACSNSTGNVYYTEAGMSSYSWALSSGGVITSGVGTRSITVTWMTGGTYTVSVNYANTNLCGATNPAEKTVTVQNTIIPVITGTNTACTGNTYIYYTTQTSMLNYLWAIPSGGGTILSGQGTSSITVTWNTLGNRTLSLTFNDPLGCTTPIPTVLSVTVNTSPTPTIIGSGSICQGSTGIVYFTESGKTGYVWTITSGGIITNGQGTNAITVNWIGLATQTITVNYTNASGCNAGSATVKVVNVLVSPNPTITGQTLICNGNSVAYTTETGMTNYEWQLPSGGTIVSGAGTNVITVHWTTIGTHSISVTYLNSSTGCPTLVPATISVTVNPSPEPTISGIDTVCLNGTVFFSTEAGNALYTWTVGSGGIITSGAGTNSIAVKWTQAGTRTVTVNYTNTSNCAAAVPAAFSIVVYAPPVPVISGLGYACAGGSEYNYSTAPGMTNYAWNVSSGGVITSGAGTNSITVAWIAAGLQAVTLSYTDYHGCNTITPSQLAVTVNTRPTPTITGTATACTGSSGNTYVTQPGMTSYVWSVSAGGTILTSPTTNASTITVAWNTPGLKTVAVNYVNGNNCNAIQPATFTCTVNDLPVPTLTGPASVCLNSITNVYKTESGKSNYNWSVSAGGVITAGGTAASDSVQVTWISTGTKTVSVNYANSFQCIAATPKTMTVAVNGLPVPSISGSGSSCPNVSTNVYSTEPAMTNYSWTVSAGGIITAGQGTQTITVTWTQVGTNTITLNYTNAYGCAAATPTVKNIVVNPLPVPAITGTPDGCLSYNSIFTTEAGMTSYSWSVTPGGTILSGTNSPTVIINWISTGQQTVTVFYTNGNGCTAVPFVKTVTVHGYVLPLISGPNQSCTGIPVTYSTEAGMTSYAWTLSPSGVITAGSGTRTITVIWYSPGVQTVTVNYVNEFGCTAVNPGSKTITVTTSPVPWIDGTNAVCQGSTGVVYSTTAGMQNYLWSVSPGGSITAGAGTATITVTWALPGLQTVTLNYTDPAGCSAANPSAKTVTVSPTPVPTITGPTPICNGSSVVYFTQPGMTGYQWAISSGGIITSGVTSRTVAVDWIGSGAQSITVTFTSADGCVAAFPSMKTITVNPLPLPTITNDPVSCISGTTTFVTEAGMSSYVWTVSSGGNIIAGAGTRSIVVGWSTSGTKTVTISYVDLNGCYPAQITSKPVIVSALPVPTISGPGLACIGSTGNIYQTEPGMTNYSWTVTSGGVITAGQGTGTITVTWNTLAPQTVSVNYTSIAGCTAAVPTLYGVTINPLPVPTLIGTSVTCAGSVNSVYVTQPGMTNYQWNVSTGGTILTSPTTSASSITVEWDVAGIQSVTVNYFNASGCNAAIPATKTVLVQVSPLPAITGAGTSCAGTTGVVYATAPGNFAYVWTISPGGIITAGSGTNQVTVSWLAAGTQTLTVNYSNSTGCSAATPGAKTVTVNALPLPVITGNSVSCINGTASYTTEAGMTGYLWTVSSGGTILSGSGSSAIQVQWTTSGAKSVTVNYTNASGCTAVLPSVKTITVYALPVPVITGSTLVCAGTSGITYSTEGGMTNYSWTVTSGGTITSGTGTNMITVTWNIPGTQGVSVNYTNAFGCSAIIPTNLTVNVNAPPVPTILGANQVCVNSGNYAYSTDPGMLNYLWTVPSGGIIVSGQGTQSIQINWSVAGINTVSVIYTSAGGCTASPSTLTVTVKSLPGAHEAIAGDTLICKPQNGVVYSIAPIPNAVGYVWNVPVFANIVSGANTNIITVNYGNATQSGNVSVFGTNSCGNGPFTPLLAVGVYPVPETPHVTAHEPDTLISSATAGNQWYREYVPIPGATGQVYLVTDIGRYFVIVNPHGCVSDTSNIIYMFPVGIEKGDAPTVKIYPNPADNMVTLAINTGSRGETLSVTLVNSIGQESVLLTDYKFSGEITKSLELGNPPNGIYHLVLQFGNHKVIRKLIIINQ